MPTRPKLSGQSKRRHGLLLYRKTQSAATTKRSSAMRRSLRTRVHCIGRHKMINSARTYTSSYAFRSIGDADDFRASTMRPFDHECCMHTNNLMHGCLRRFQKGSDSGRGPHANRCSCRSDALKREILFYDCANAFYEIKREGQDIDRQIMRLDATDQIFHHAFP